MVVPEEVAEAKLGADLIAPCSAAGTEPFIGGSGDDSAIPNVIA